MSFKLAVTALVLVAGPLAAQEEQDTVDLMQAATRSPVLAAALEGWLLLPVGHWYAGDVKRGLLPTVVKLGALPLAFQCVDLAGGSASCSDTREKIAAVGAFAFVGGWVWGMVSAYRTASDRNEAIRTRFGSVEVRYGIRPATSRLEFGATLRLRQ